MNSVTVYQPGRSSYILGKNLELHCSLHGSNSNLERPRLTSPPHIMMLMVCRPPTRPHAHESMSGGRGRMMHSSSSCSLATRTTSRRNGTRTSVTGMIQIARSRISIVVAAVGLVLPLAGDFCLCWCGDLLRPRSTPDLSPPQPQARQDPKLRMRDDGQLPLPSLTGQASVALPCSRSVAC